MLNSSQKTQLIEGILFLKGKMGIKREELLKIIKIKEEELSLILDEINEKYLKVNSPFLIKLNGNKIRISLNKETSELISKKLNKPLKVKLSKSSIEVLTIISYYQPITRKQIDKIRKANSDYIISKLQNLDLIESVQRANTPGNPRLWTTTNLFLESFDLEKIQDLPDYEEKKSFEENLYYELNKENEIRNSKFNKKINDDISSYVDFEDDDFEDDDFEKTNENNIKEEIFEDVTVEVTSESLLDFNSEKEEE